METVERAITTSVKNATERAHKQKRQLQGRLLFQIVAARDPARAKQILSESESPRLRWETARDLLATLPEGRWTPEMRRHLLRTLLGDGALVQQIEDPETEQASIEACPYTDLILLPNDGDVRAFLVELANYLPEHREAILRAALREVSMYCLDT